MDKDFITLDEMFPEFIGKPLPLRCRILIWWCNLKGKIRSLFILEDFLDV